MSKFPLALCAFVCALPIQAKDRVRVHVEFGSSDRVVISEYYRGHNVKGLPPGIEKQLRRNGRLPPGLVKKLRPFPAELERRLPPLAPGTRRCLVEDRAIIYNPQSMVVLDVMVLIR
jgi:hypothetical protein